MTSIEVKGNRYGTIEHAFLLLTTDLTGGGWSEPVFGDDELIGLTVAQEGQIASVVPAEIIGAYLTRARNGEAYRGFASISAGWQNNRDPALSAHLGLRRAASRRRDHADSLGNLRLRRTRRCKMSCWHWRVTRSTPSGTTSIRAMDACASRIWPPPATGPGTSSRRRCSAKGN